VKNGVLTSGGNDYPSATQRSAPAVRKLILTATGCMCLAAGAYFLDTVVGQEKPARKEAPAEEIPHRIALIDMEYVFQNYEKLKYLQEELNAELKDEKDKYEAKVKKGQAMVAELKDYKQDTPEFDARRQKIEKLQQDLKFDEKQVQIKMQREMAKMKLTIYHETRDAVEKFCRRFNYTLAVQFIRSEANSSDPQRMMQIMGQPVVYYRKSDSGKCRDDLSEPVVKWLNEKYAKDSGGEATAEKPAKKDKNLKQAESTEPSGGPRRSKTAD
jgi:Skp family chaperone for outer membrane proteins